MATMFQLDEEMVFCSVSFKMKWHYKFPCTNDIPEARYLAVWQEDLFQDVAGWLDYLQGNTAIESHSNDSTEESSEVLSTEADAEDLSFMTGSRARSIDRMGSARELGTDVAAV